jgi:hypothetical protein
MKLTRLETLVLQERHTLFSRAYFALSVVNTRLGQEVVLPCLALRFRIEAVS